MATVSKISPCIWFDGQADDAAAFYTKVFDGRILRTLPYSGDGPQAGTTMLVDFEIEGLQFTALNGGPQFTPDEAVSFQILCEDQAEIDRYWDALVDGGEEAAVRLAPGSLPRVVADLPDLALRPARPRATRPASSGRRRR